MAKDLGERFAFQRFIVSRPGHADSRKSLCRVIWVVGPLIGFVNLAYQQVLDAGQNAGFRLRLFEPLAELVHASG